MAKHGKFQIALEYALARAILSSLGVLNMHSRGQFSPAWACCRAGWR